MKRWQKPSEQTCAKKEDILVHTVVRVIHLHHTLLIQHHLIDTVGGGGMSVSEVSEVRQVSVSVVSVNR